MSEHLVNIKVVGVGGAGGNAINDMIRSGVSGVEFIAANTDAQDLLNSLADIKVQLGRELTKGLGAGANPEIGKKAVEEDRETVKELLHNTDMLFITAGMGGGTGTGAAPAIAEIAKEMGILTIAIGTKPFQFEGKRRKENAENGISSLSDHVDTLVMIPNDKLFELPNKTITLKNAFEEANNILKIGVRGVSELITKHGFINLDFADIRTTTQNSGIAMLGFGEATGENRALKATQQALSNPLLEKSIEGAKRILLNITGGEDFTLTEAYEISNAVRDAAGSQNAEDVMFGTVIDDELEDTVKVTIVATDFVEFEAKEIKDKKNKAQVEMYKAMNATSGAATTTDADPLDIPAFIRRRKD